MFNLVATLVRETCMRYEEGQKKHDTGKRCKESETLKDGITWSTNLDPVTDIGAFHDVIEALMSDNFARDSDDWR